MENNIRLVLGDITKIDCECIVNAANKSLLGGGGVDGAIHKAAGEELLKECASLGGCRTGEAKITKGYKLKAEYIIHTVGPVYSGKPGDSELLSSCYKSSLDLAALYDIHSIAFPAISTGVYRYPLSEAAPIAANTVKNWLNAHPDYGMNVIFSCFDEKTYNALKAALSLS